MPPAARVGDQTSHGTPLGPGPGSANVLIEGKPAWRSVSDFHVCSQMTGNVPHQGGRVALGSTSIMINNLPAARQGDAIIESAPPNTIIGGAASVLFS
jgi:uncharacterized Zn-binding protein involved in type VI secretion